MSKQEATQILIDEMKQTYGKDWHTAVVDEAMRLHAVVRAGLHANGDLQRYHLLRRFVCGQVQAADSMAELLEKAPRMGADEDKPEASRYIQMSDTLADMLAKSIRHSLPIDHHFIAVPK